MYTLDRARYSLPQVGEELGVCGLVKQGKEQTKTDQENEAKLIKCETGRQQDNMNMVTPLIVQHQQQVDATKENHVNPTDVMNPENPPAKTNIEDIKVPLSFTELVSPQSRKYPCNKCNIQFPNIATLRRHPCNQNEKCFECDLCPFKFQLEILLQQHIEAKHMGRPEPKQPKRRKQYSAPTGPDRRAFNKHSNKY